MYCVSYIILPCVQSYGLRFFVLCALLSVLCNNICCVWLSGVFLVMLVLWCAVGYVCLLCLMLRVVCNLMYCIILRYVL